MAIQVSMLKMMMLLLQMTIFIWWAVYINGPLTSGAEPSWVLKFKAHSTPCSCRLTKTSLQFKFCRACESFVPDAQSLTVVYWSSLGVNFAFTASIGELIDYGHEYSNGSVFHIALLTYDTILTLSDEIDCIWKKRFTLGSGLYLLARYPMLLFLFMEALLQFLNDSLQVNCCSGFNSFQWHFLM